MSLEINDLCIVCKKNKKSRRNMCNKCGKLEKLKMDQENGVYKCINIKICKKNTDDPNDECNDCKNYPKQFLLEENYGLKPILKGIDILCQNINCYCCPEESCKSKQTIGTPYCKNCYIVTERIKNGIKTCSNIKRCKNIISSNDPHLRCEKCRTDDIGYCKSKRSK